MHPSFVACTVLDQYTRKVEQEADMEVNGRVSILLYMFCFTSLPRHQSMVTAVPGTFYRPFPSLYKLTFPCLDSYFKSDFHFSKVNASVSLPFNPKI